MQSEKQDATINSTATAAGHVSSSRTFCLVMAGTAIPNHQCFLGRATEGLAKPQLSQIKDMLLSLVIFVAWYTNIDVTQHDLSAAW